MLNHETYDEVRAIRCGAELRDRLADTMRELDRRHQLAALAESWEPGASATPPRRRLSTCAACARRMVLPWHFWLDSGGFKKELHICNRCVRRRGWKS